MRLLIKVSAFLFFVLFSYSIYGQISNHSISKSQDFEFEKDDHYAIAKVGLYRPVPISNSFIKDTYNYKYGINFQFYTNLSETDFLLGLRVSLAAFDVRSNSRSGNFERSNSTFIGAEAGYQFFPRDSFRVLLSAGAGSLSYEQYLNSLEFSDYGHAVFVSSEASYHFNKTIGIYLSSILQGEYLDIEVIESEEDYFRSIYTLNLSFGLRVLF